MVEAGLAREVPVGTRPFLAAGEGAVAIRT